MMFQGHFTTDLKQMEAALDTLETDPSDCIQEHSPGMSIILQGNAFKEIDSPHYVANESLEGFWNDFNRGGDRYGNIMMPLIEKSGMSCNETSLRALAGSRSFTF